ncbi:glucose-6-phosphate dehydrogenase [Rothia sp. AR01]|uniref:Glucose-6-phosphate dehydrogenase n=1 Tax=Rothia santali TaxID=2949643 RepID=A0A9X2HEK1_9MICC|nr:glucose-6-phosphate dehydrogenase [Rothia santali]MCP3426650.1 glucose-6-phosphate dehydrogenase [Rothia santali]
MSSTLDTVIVCGANGDLSHRLLLPGLATYLAERRPERGVELIGVGRREDPGFAEAAREAFGGVLDEEALRREGPRRTLESAQYLQVDVTDAEGLGRALEEAGGTPVVYLALAPDVVVQACHALAGIAERGALPEGMVLAVEKPFGSDRESARGLDDLLASILPEERIVRVDHFLGMPGVLGIPGLRWGNPGFAGRWDAEHVERVEIVFDETLGLEGRADFYDGTGAAEDMIQSHLLQTMGMLMMETPAEASGDALQRGSAEVIAAAGLDPEDPDAVFRGRYTSGQVGGEDLPDYTDEEGVDPERGTETFARVVVRVGLPRWEGVPVILRSGKAVGSPRQEIAVHFRADPEAAQGRPRGLGEARGDTLRIGLEDGDVRWDLTAGGPHSPGGVRRITLSSAVGEEPLTPYGAVFLGIFGGDAALRVAPGTPEEGWRVLEEVRAAYREGRAPLRSYPAGSIDPDRG